VCILLELCKYGSLSDVLRQGKAGKGKRLVISYFDLLSLAVGCCRGLTALHAKGKDVCHRDIKSYNFLSK
jgi:serine/threonine protein kinase